MLVNISIKYMDHIFSDTRGDITSDILPPTIFRKHDIARTKICLGYISNCSQYIVQPIFSMLSLDVIYEKLF